MKDSLGMLAAAVVAAAGVWFYLSKLEDPEGKSWALPAGLAVLIGGAGYALYMPAWMNAGIFLLVVFLLHQNARTRLEKAAARLSSVELQEEGLRLQRLPDPAKRHVGEWVVSGGAQASGFAGTAPAAPGASYAPGTAGSGIMPAAPLAATALTLDFVGETEDEYSVVLGARSPRYCPGVVVCHHNEARGAAWKVLPEPERLSDLPGLTHDLVVRAMPSDYGIRLLDLATLALVSDIVSLRKAGREVYIHVSGPDVRVVSSGVFDAGELGRLLAASVRLERRVRSVGVES